MSTDLESPIAAHLTGRRVALVGRLAGMPKRDAQQLIRRAGGVPMGAADSSSESQPSDGIPQLIVVGEEFPLPTDAISADLVRRRHASRHRSRRCRSDRRKRILAAARSAG